MCGDGKSETNVHSARIALDWRIEEFLDFGKFYDLVKFTFDLSAPHAKNCAIQVDVFAARKLWMKSRADFKQARHPSLNRHRAFGRLRNSGKDLEQRALSRPVVADDSHHLTTLDFEAKVSQRPKFLHGLAYSRGAAPREISG